MTDHFTLKTRPTDNSFVIIMTIMGNNFYNAFILYHTYSLVINYITTVKNITWDLLYNKF